MNGVIICVAARKLYETYCSRKVWYESCNNDISGKQNVYNLWYVIMRSQQAQQRPFS